MKLLFLTIILFSLTLNFLFANPEETRSLMPVPPRLDLVRINIAFKEEIKELEQIGCIINKAQEKFCIAEVSPDLLTKLSKHGYKFTVLQENISGVYYSNFFTETDFARYLTYEEFRDTMCTIAANNSTICKLETLGLSHAGRLILAMKISDNPYSDETEPVVYFDGNTHGDEKIGWAVCFEFIRYIMLNYSTNPTVSNLVNNREIWVVPMINPDGYVAGVRYNNRNVDLNRNYGWMWGNEYNCGTDAFSENEAALFYDLFVKHPFVIYTTYHAGDSIISYPWSYTDYDTVPEKFIIHHLAQGYSQRGNNYPYGQGSILMYYINGSSKDYTYGIGGEVSWLIEVHNTKTPPASAIEPTFNINRDAILWLCHKAGQGIHGVVTDSVTGQPLYAQVWVQNRNWLSYASPTNGDFHRFYLPGSYSLKVRCPGYQEKTVSVVVPNTGDSSVTVNVMLKPNSNITNFGMRVVTCRYVTISSNLTYPIRSLGPHDGQGYQLDNTKWIVLDMYKPIHNITGNDFSVYRSSGTGSAVVKVSNNWKGTWTTIGTANNNQSSFDINSVGFDSVRYIRLESSGNFIFDAIEAPAPISYTITASASSGGTISPSGVIVVNQGVDTTFMITPNTGYHTDSVIVDEANQGVITGYTFYNVSANHSITAYFSINRYSITASTVGNGTISPSGVTIVNYGSNQSYTITSATGHHIDSVIVDGTNIGTPTNYTFNNVIATHTITAYFSINQYTITASAVGGGIITPSGTIIVNYGGDTTFTMIPNTNYHIDSVKVDEINVGAPTNYQFTNIQTNHVITAYFSINTYTINAFAGSGGTITPSGAILINHGSDTSFTFTANLGYHIETVVVDGESLGPISHYEFLNVVEDHTIYALFNINTYTLDVTIIGNGIVTREPDLSEYEHGTSVTLTATPNMYWTFTGWSGDTISSNNPIVITMNDNKNIVATFMLVGAPGWAPKENIPTQIAGKWVKDGGSLIAVRNNIHAFRGSNSNEFYLYDGTSWMLKESLPFGRKPTDPTKINKKKVGKGASLCYDGDSIIYATKGNSTKEFWAYNINQNSWTAKPFVPITKYLKGGTSIAYSDGKVYLFAGHQRVIDWTFFVYDVITNTWDTLMPILLTPDRKRFKDGSCIALIRDTIYCLKGRGKHNYFWAYVIANDAWVQKETIPLKPPSLGNKKNIVKDGGAMATDGSVIYAIKGGGTQEFWKYTPGSPGVWTALETIPRLHKKSVPKTGAALTYVNGVVYLLKGNNTQEFWQYAPSTEKSKIKYQISKMTESTSPCNLPVEQGFSLANKIIHYTIPISGKVTLKLYNATGRLIEILNNSYLNAGSYCMQLSTEHLAKGIYLLRFNTEKYYHNLKLIIQ